MSKFLLDFVSLNGVGVLDFLSERPRGWPHGPSAAPGARMQGGLMVLKIWIDREAPTILEKAQLTIEVVLRVWQ